MKILLADWASRHYSPPPTQWVLRKWVRAGEIYPAPEKVGSAYYVEEAAQRYSDPALIPTSPPDPVESDRQNLVVSRASAMAATREFYDPRHGGPGVYIVFDADRNECVYVGSSLQLANRLRNGGHVPSDLPTFCFSVPPEQIRDVEAAYWAALQPSMNKIAPPASKLDLALVAAIREAWGMGARH